ncbi:hypothetical protein RJ641_000738, partial [Dillenia turbinata]
AGWMKLLLDASIIGEDARFLPPVAIRSSLVVIATMRARLLRPVVTVESLLGEYFCGACKFYDDDVLILSYNSFIVMFVGFVELGDMKTSFAAGNVPLTSEAIFVIYLIGQVTDPYVSRMRTTHKSLFFSFSSLCRQLLQKHRILLLGLRRIAVLSAMRFCLFDSVSVTTIMKCGHTMHMDCYYEMAIKTSIVAPFAPNQYSTCQEPGKD